MSARVTWQPSTDADILSYDLERAPSIGGPWSLLLNVLHNPLSGANPYWDVENTQFFYVDSAGTETTYYRLTAIDAVGQRSAVSNPFKAVGATYAGLPALVGVVTMTVGDVASLLDLGFTTIEVWHSIDDGGTWVEITAPSFTPATSTSRATLNTYRIGGEYLRFKLSDGVEQVVTFDPALPDWTPAQVASKINETVADFASVVSETVVLQTPTTGRQSSLEIVSSPIALDFPRSLTYGKDARLVLVDGSLIYTFYDTASTETSRYKWRFSDNGATPVSVFSKYVLPRSTATTGAALSVGTARFIGMDGRPIQAKLIISALSMPGQGALLTSTTMVVEADEQGFAQTPLVVGARILVALEGTGFVREIVVPNQPTFDILTVAGAAPDLFTPQTVPPLLTRRSL
jgi:hypothetical protein